MSIKNNFPSILPSLNLDFANSKRLDPRITFTRASTGTYYDGKTTAKAEENLCTYSQNFSVWTQTGTTITSDSLAAPDGTTTADTMVNTATTNSHLVGLSPIRVNPGTTYTVSIFVKRNTVNFFQIAAILDTDNARANFDILNGTAGSTGNTLTATSTITAYPNSWYRCTMTVTAPTTVNPANYISIYFCHVQSNTAAIFESYLGTTSQSSYIWGAQLEQRSAAAAYVPTTTTRVTNYIPRLLTAGANVPRFDHDPVTGESLGLLIEESRTNLLTRSQEFDNATSWNNLSASTNANVNIAPDGTLTADSIAQTGILGYTSQLYGSTASTTYTLSVYAKATKSTDYLGLSIQPSYVNRIGARYDLNAGTVIGATAPGGSTSTLLETSIVSVGNGWYRCSITATVAETNAAARWYIGPSDNTQTNADPFGSSTLRTIYIWGAQLEIGTHPTSYIPTTTTTVTRPADIIVMDGTNFSSWFNNSEGTLLLDVIYNTDFSGTVIETNSLTLYSNNNLSFGDAIRIRTIRGVSISDCIIVYGNNIIYDSSGFTIVKGNNYKRAISFKDNTLKHVQNGNIDGNNFNMLKMPQLVGLTIDSIYLPCLMYVKQLSFYPKQLSDIELQKLTNL